MNVGRATTLIFAVLLCAAVANAQFVPQNPYANPYAVPQAMSQVMPAPTYQSWNPYQQPTSIMPVPGYMPQQPYGFGMQSSPYTLPSYDYSLPSYDSFSNPYSMGANSEDDEEKRERAEERREEREERREELKRQREEEREARKREERLERDRARRGEEPESNGNAEASTEVKKEINVKELNNWPPVPKSSAKAAEVIAAQKKEDQAPKAKANQSAGNAEKPAAAKSAVAKPEIKPEAKPVVAAKPAEAKPAPRQPSWWENHPAYQQYLKDKKSFEEAKKANADWPPKPKPVITQPAPQKQIQSTTGALAASAATDCATCGPTKGPLAQQVEQLKELADPREVFVLTKPPTNRVGEGIRKVINTIYQSCDAYNTLLRPDYCQEGFIGKNYCAKTHKRETGDLTAYKNPEEFFSLKIASQPGSNVMTPTKPEGPQCRDMNKTPPVFKLGGRPQISVAGGKVKLNLYNNNTKLNSSSFVTMDCSGFVSAAYTAAGLNFVPNSPTSQVTTKSLRDGAASCLATVSFTANKSIESGDVAVFAGESQHSMIFDRVGADPFGIAEIPAAPAGANPATHCRNNLKPSKFDFVIAQSGLYGGRAAVSQARAVDYVVNFGNGMMDGINAQIMQLAEDACVTKLTGTSRKADRPGAAKLLRHKGASAPGCVRASQPEINGQQCVKGCT